MLLPLLLRGGPSLGVLDFGSPKPSSTHAAGPGAAAAGAAEAFALVADREAGGHLTSWPMHLSMCGHVKSGNGQCAGRMPGAFVGETWSSTKSRAVDGGRGVAVIGSSRMFFAKPGAGKQWYDVKYEKLFLLGRALSFTVDLSSVGCGCNAVSLSKRSTPHAGWFSEWFDRGFPLNVHCMPSPSLPNLRRYTSSP